MTTARFGFECVGALLGRGVAHMVLVFVCTYGSKASRRVITGPTAEAIAAADLIPENLEAQLPATIPDAWKRALIARANAKAQLINPVIVLSTLEEAIRTPSPLQ